MFNDKFPIAYEVAKSSTKSEEEHNLEIVPILLLNGFGVGSFHQHRLMRQMLQLEQEDQQNNTGAGGEQQIKRKQFVIYGIDYLGQGKSWPANCNDGESNDEFNLGYSANLWLDQIQGFIEEVILPSSSNQKVHLAGNSVGGYIATILTNRHPSLIASLTLMNATPVWGLNLMGWDGKLPAPAFPKLVGRKLFDTIRDMDVIDKYLEAAYVHRSAFDGTFDDSFNGDCEGDVKAAALPPKIRGCTEGKGGHAAFASILWSAPASNNDPAIATTADEDDATNANPSDFYTALKNVPVDVLLLFGENDPWCTPAVAKRMHTTLAERGGSAQQRYISLDNVGHCPNNEAPMAVATVLSSWIAGGGAESEALSLVEHGNMQITEPWGVVGVREVSIEESEDLGFMDRIVSSMVG